MSEVNGDIVLLYHRRLLVVLLLRVNRKTVARISCNQFFQLVSKIQCKFPKLLGVHISVSCVSSFPLVVFLYTRKTKRKFKKLPGDTLMSYSRCL